MIDHQSLTTNYSDFKITNLEGYDSNANNGVYPTNEYNSINKNFNTINNDLSKLKTVKDNYDRNKDEIHDYKTNLVNKKTNSLAEIRKNDSETYMIQENFIYILGSVTFAIVLVGAIVIIKN